MENRAYGDRNKDTHIDAISVEDVDFIKEMVALPRESKSLAWWIIIGLKLKEQIDFICEQVEIPSSPRQSAGPRTFGPARRGRQRKEVRGE